MKSLEIFVYDDGKQIEDINISLSETYIFYSDRHPEIMMASKEEILKEIEARLEK